jgi:hypothetical protein
MTQSEFKKLIREEIQNTLQELSPLSTNGWADGNYLQAAVARQLNAAGSALTRKREANLKKDITDEAVLKKEIDTILATYGFVLSKDFNKIYKARNGKEYNE